jgi:HAE1 family hydrophobic/amphiphilic exporter-1
VFDLHPAQAIGFVAVCLCLLLVYAVMASLFESFLQPFAILITCLLGCLGAPWAMWWTDTTVDITAMVGLFILIGIVVNNGIMLIDRTIQLRSAGIPRDEALALAGRVRIRPILMTAGTTILGLVPMLIHHPTLAGVYYHAIAPLIAGRLLTSTVVTLVFLPASYSLLEDLALASRARWRAPSPALSVVGTVPRLSPVGPSASAPAPAVIRLNREQRAQRGMRER